MDTSKQQEFIDKVNALQIEYGVKIVAQSQLVVIPNEAPVEAPKTEAVEETKEEPKETV